MTTTATYADIPGLAGTDLGFTDWLEITQESVDTFADATGDHQWIHVDPERAKDGPFGGPIAHGFLTLSLAVKFWTDLLDVDGVSTKVNYGLDKVRFISPVKVGSRIRAKSVLSSVDLKDGNTIQYVRTMTVEIEGEEKPALVAEWISRLIYS